MNKTQAILALLIEGVADHEVANRVGVRNDYVRAVRSRHNARSAPLPSPRRTGQPREELRELAETLYRWRTDGRHA